MSDLNEQLNTWPEEIWLQHGCDELRDYAEVRGSELTWCVDNINESDVRYVRADLAAAAAPAPVAAITSDPIDDFQQAVSDFRKAAFERDLDAIFPAQVRLFDAFRAALSTAPQAQAAPIVQAVAAWMHPDGRVVPASTMDAAKRDGGAMLSSLRGYTIPLSAPTSSTADAKDSERYRWMRDESPTKHARVPTVFLADYPSEPDWNLFLHGEALDVAIDAAITSSAGEVKP